MQLHVSLPRIDNLANGTNCKIMKILLLALSFSLFYLFVVVVSGGDVVGWAVWWW
jgi:hypothetical protein